VEQYFKGGEGADELPIEWLEFKWMTELYHCTPIEFEKQPSQTIEMHRQFLILQGQKDDLETKRRAQEAKLKRKMNKKS
jgi:hypothetical protein